MSNGGEEAIIDSAFSHSQGHSLWGPRSAWDGSPVCLSLVQVLCANLCLCLRGVTEPQKKKRDEHFRLYVALVLLPSACLKTRLSSEYWPSNSAIFQILRFLFFVLTQYLIAIVSRDRIVLTYPSLPLPL